MTSSEKPLPELKKRRLSAKQLQQPNLRLGQRGEARAVHFLQSKGFQILDVNIRVGVCELDIVALDPELNEVVFVEVKTRGQAFSDSAVHAVDHRKLRAMAKAAGVYLRSRNLANDYRFDMISVLPSRLEHFENVTWNRRR